LVGGHCISVDPYYLAHKAESLGYYPEVILSGRRVNSRMDRFVASKAIKYMIQSKVDVNDSKALILGIAFKENCPDIRNTKVVGIVHELEDFGLDVDVCDPLADTKEVQENFNITLLESPILDKYALIILAVPHSVFLDGINFDFMSLSTPILFDIKAVLPRHIDTIRL